MLSTSAQHNCFPFAIDFTVKVNGVPPDITEDEVAEHFRNLLDRKVVEVRTLYGEVNKHGVHEHSRVLSKASRNRTQDVVVPFRKVNKIVNKVWRATTDELVEAVVYRARRATGAM